ncbi:cysteine proteinase [Wilcoxina mikolae CBS 423.85]|nr:cysteine proteinase [Wilcoxina mikolae CBS 423.85]
MTLKPSLPPTSESRGKKRASSDDIEGEVAVAPQAKRARVVGLKNLGNTCYNNAVIQALSHTAPLREYFLDRCIPSVNNVENLSNGASKQEDAAIQVQLHTSRPRTRRAAQLEEEILVPADVNLCNEFSKLLRAMWGTDIDDATDVTTTKKRRASSRLASVVSPHAFAGAVATLLPLFQERYEQQDAQEFLRCALERMQEELIMERIETGEGSVDLIREAENTIVKRVFGGILWNKISCLSCNEYTIKPDPFLDLSLVIPDPASLQTTAATSPPTGKPNKLVTLEDCIDLFSSSEDLEAIPASDLASRSCRACGSDHGFSKAFTLGELPRVLCIHLKRFRWKRNTTRGSKQKVDTLVKFPLEGLDMTRWLSDHETHNGNALYELYAVVVHQGSGANSGHYTAFVKNRDEWWSLNDERASRVQPEQVLKAKAYLLFYRQQETLSSTAAVSETAEPQL